MDILILVKVACLIVAINLLSVIFCFLLLLRNFKKYQRAIESLHNEFKMNRASGERTQTQQLHPLEARLHQLQNARFSKMSIRKDEK